MIDPLHLQAADDESALVVLADRYEEAGRLDVAAALRAPGVPWGALTDDQQRVVAYRAADRACRIYAPRALRAAGLDAEASRLEGLAPIVDADSARAARAAAESAAESAAAESAARTAARTVARAAGWAAAWSATRSAVRAPRSAAAWAAREATSSAAWAARAAESESAEIALQRRDAILALGGAS